MCRLHNWFAIGFIKRRGLPYSPTWPAIYRRYTPFFAKELGASLGFLLGKPDDVIFARNFLKTEKREFDAYLLEFSAFPAFRHVMNVTGA